MIKKPYVILRILCAAVDVLLIMLPIQFVMLGVFGVSPGQADFFFKLLFAVYGALFTEYWGKTPGKYFGKLKVLEVNGDKPGLLYLGLRELAKSLYLIPVIGWAALLTSVGMMICRKDGRTLHDVIGSTRVVYQWQALKEDDDEH